MCIAQQNITKNSIRFDDAKLNSILSVIQADGQIKLAEYANGVQSSWRHDVSMANADLREDFSYDTLNRLTSSTVSGAGANLYQMVGLDTINLTYNALGNLISKTDAGAYTYGANGAGPHAVTGIFGVKNATYRYDDNGNMLSGDGRTVSYTSFNKPNAISKGGNTTHMQYGPGRELIRQVETQNGDTTITTYIGGLYEELEKDSTRKAKHHLNIAGQTIAVVNYTIEQNPQDPQYELYSYEDTHYLHRDHLNSITAITNQEGKLIDRFHYDAFGKRRTAIQAPYNNIAMAGFFPTTSRGYTGHKQLEGTDLIHMEGRVYDPEIGRFLSADPYVQSPLNTQSLNRYSYVNNNPLSYTDPSGYFSLNPFKAIKKLFKKIGNLISKVVKAVAKAVTNVVRKVVKVVKKYAKVIVAVAIAVVAPYALAAIASGAGILATGSVALSTMSAGMTIAAGAIGGGLAGLVTTGTLRGMLIGAVSGAAFAGVGNHFAGVKAGNAAGLNTLGNGLTSAQQAGKVLAHGVVGGVRSVLSGGTFKAGFSSAGFTQAFAPAIDHIPDGVGGAGQLVAAGVVGGTASELAGGEFEDGFVTGIFSHGFNQMLHDKVTSAELRRLGKEVQYAAKGQLKILENWLGSNGMNHPFYSRALNMTHDLRGIHATGVVWEAGSIAADLGTVSFQMKPTSWFDVVVNIGAIVVPSLNSYNIGYTQNVSCDFGSGACGLTVTNPETLQVVHDQ